MDFDKMRPCPGSFSFFPDFGADSHRAADGFEDEERKCGVSA
jgi:hypothetical protein